MCPVLHACCEQSKTETTLMRTMNCLGGKTNSVHVATPYPKQAGKAAANDKQQVKQQTPKSGGDYSCKPCNR